VGMGRRDSLGGRPRQPEVARRGPEAHGRTARDLEAIAAAIGRLPLLDADDRGFQDQGELIARLCGDYDTFQTLDETPGIVGSDRDAAGCLWHVKLRRARNSCERFFDLLGQSGP
jgi:hypothetical protein